jgi:hypothetical protein
MAPSKKKGGNSGPGGSEVGFGKRLLVILYAAGIVAIGAYPIQREFGSVYNFLDIKIRQYANTSLPDEIGSLREKGVGISQFFRGSEDKSQSSSKTTRARLSEPEVKRLKLGSGRPRDAAQESDLDEIDARDKEALDNLIAEKMQ